MNFFTRRVVVLFALLCTTLMGLASETNWVSLFNGRDLTGWQVVNDGAFTVTNGTFHIEGGMGWLRSENQFGDFVLEAGWRGLETNYNSGFFVRSGLAGKPFPDGGWQVNLKQSALGALVKGKDVVQPSKTPARPVGEWTQFRIEARGKLLTLFVNDEKAWEYADLEPARGFIGIQAEGKRMEFRNLRLRKLDQ